MKQPKINLTRPLFILPFCFVFLNGYAQSKDSVSLSSLIKKNSFALRDGNFQGTGWDILQKEAEKVQFLMIGEQHGEAEIPVFTEKIADVFKPKAFVAEIDPYSAERLKKIAPNPTGYVAHFNKWPYDLAFYCWETEMHLAKKLITSKVDIWGLNEITFMSTGLFFEELSNIAKIPANKQLALKKAIEYGLNDKPLYLDANTFNELSLFKLTTGYLDSLQFTFRNDNKQSQKMLRDLRASRPLLWENYPMRVEMMKKNLLNYVAPYIGRDSISIPKLLFKFGANHLTRSNSTTGFYEVGNLADNLAAAQGKKTLHILIFGKQGTINTMLSTDNKKAIQTYNVKDDKDLTSFKPFYSLVNDDEWAVFDLRPIRAALKRGSLKGSNLEMENLLTGFDLLVLFSPVTGNKFIH
ncbi:hypothetical protein [Pedobacter sp. HMWF019]|uniref:hypothetical protein n=1 Tax=Pedobacter sp. HMWF019 TaxID=2056856 RepID=UPI0011B27B06|nr:hypothetical protein [Pedobacter sp. HMWF019]